MEETVDVVDQGFHAGDPHAPTHEAQWLRCPSCGYECEAEAFLQPFEPDPAKGPAPTEDEWAKATGFDGIFAEVGA